MTDTKVHKWDKRSESDEKLPRHDFSTTLEYIQQCSNDMNEHSQKYFLDPESSNYKAFWLACARENNFDRFKKLMNMIQVYKMDINKITPWKITGYMIVCAYNPNVNIVRYLVEQLKVDTKICHSEDKYNGFQLACFNNDVEIIRYLKENKKVEKKSKYDLDESGLLLIFETKKIEVIKFLVEEYKYDILKNRKIAIREKPTQTENAFLFACKRNTNLPVIRYLVKHLNNLGININNCHDENKCNALMGACGPLQTSEVVKFLVEETNIDIYAKDTDGLNCIIYLIISASKCEEKILFEKLEHLDQKFDINAKLDGKRNTLMNACVTCDNLELVKLIASKTFNLNEIDEEDNTAFISACRYNKNIQIIKYFIEDLKININNLTNNMEKISPECKKYLIDSKYYLLIDESQSLEDKKIETDQNIYQEIVSSCLKGYTRNTLLFEKLNYKKILSLTKKGLYIEPETGMPIHELKIIKLPFKHLIPENFLQEKKDYLIDAIFRINNTTYYGHRQLIFAQSETLMNLFTMANISNQRAHAENIELISTIDSEIVEIYLRTFYTGELDEIKNLDVSKLIDLCQFVEKYPTNLLTVENLEQYLVSRYDTRYLDFYISLVERNCLYHLMKLVYQKK
ncbi:MAG: hypothetical protein Dasosvirus1_23 [Dasosvirus sp.]|uniref:BTB domain-containing protein n=1 Tax=Dasosvirus sp. TaxID=2487764 RepID=A0A3G4ZR62_9VIRU|nr:MAG: hypothetical protein Dasosvirus1_23 [Dasosvirus sp.]